MTAQSGRDHRKRKQGETQKRNEGRVQGTVNRNERRGEERQGEEGKAGGRWGRSDDAEAEITEGQRPEEKWA